MKTVAKIYFFLILFILYFPAAAAAQAPYHTQWKHLINRDYVNALAIDETVLWQGINGGLVKRSLYGPAASRHYHKLNSQLQAAQVLAVAVDDRGNLWAGTENGIFHRNAEGQWSNFNRDNSPLTVNMVLAVVPDNRGGAWFGTWAGGAYHRSDLGTWTVYNTRNSSIPGNRIQAIAPDIAGGVWFGTDSNGAAYLDSSGAWTVYTAANSPLPTNDVQDILVDYRGRVWFATMSGLVCLERGGSWSRFQPDREDHWTVYNLENSEIPSEIVNALALDSAGNLWLGTNAGLASLKTIRDDSIWEVYTTSNSSLPAPLVRSVAIDGGGTVWAGTWGGGIAGYYPQSDSWHVYKQDTLSLTGGSELPTNTINMILPFPEGNGSGIAWFATASGVARYDGIAAKWETLGDHYKLPVNQVNSLARDSRGNIAFATAGGGLAVRSAAGAWSYYNKENSPIPSNNLEDVAYDNQGRIWMVAERGEAAYLTPAGQWTVYRSADNRENSDLPAGDYQLNSVYCDWAGNTWFGTWGGGTLLLDRAGNWTVYKAGPGSMQSNDVSSIIGDWAGNTWFGTWGGGVALLDRTGSWLVFNDANSALPSNIVRDLALDIRGWVWAATPQGVAYYDGVDWHPLHARDSGLSDDNIWNMATDSLGNVWFATNGNGVAVYNPDGVVPTLAELTDITESETEIIILYGGRHLKSDVSPLLRDGRLLLPMRPLATALGAALHWDGSIGRVEMTLGGKTVEVFINETGAYINGEPYTLDVPARLHEGRTMVPLRFISEALGIEVTWDGEIGAAFLK